MSSTAGLILHGIKPDSGWPGTVATIFGDGFSGHLDGNNVVIGGANALVLRASSNELEILLGENTSTGPITVTTGVSNATLPHDFHILPDPELEDSSVHGAPATFHGPHHGTPALGARDQRVLLIFCNGKGDAPANIPAEIAAEMVTYDQANRFWGEATYAPGVRGTTFAFTQAPWVELPQSRNSYIWDDVDIDSRRKTFLTETKRWATATATGVLCAHRGGGLSITNLSNPLAENGRLAATWVAQHVAVNGTTAFVAAGAEGLIAVDISGTPVELGRLRTGRYLQACDIVGSVLIAAALEGGVDIYDISDPRNITLSANFSTGRNWATCVKALSSSRVIVGSGGALTILDVSIPSTPTFVAFVPVHNSAWVLGVDAVGDTCIAATADGGLVTISLASTPPATKGTLQEVPVIFSVQIFGNKAIAACGPRGVMMVDIADLTSPKLLGRNATTPSCFHVTTPIAATPPLVVLASLGGRAVSLVEPSDTPVIGPTFDLTTSPGLGADPDSNALKANLDIAIEGRGLIKSNDIWIHAINQVRVTDPTINLDGFEGIIVMINGRLGRGQSGLYQSLTPSTGAPLRFNNTKGLIWLPSGAHFGRKAHELGHWFGMPDIYSDWFADGTVRDGTASDWDMAGNHDLVPLFSGHQAMQMKLYDSENVTEVTWDPANAPSANEYVVVSHAFVENPPNDTKAQINLLKIKVASGLTYYVEVRQKPGAWIFDPNIPIPPSGTSNGRVLVTRADEEQFLSNTFERKVSTFAVLDSGESVTDALRLLRIEVMGVVQTDPLAYRIKLHMNEVPPENAGGQFDLRITDWDTSTWETVDIWVNNPKNDGSTPRYEFHEGGNDTKPRLSGDRPWVHHDNTIMARISNSGIRDAEHVTVTAYVTAPPGIGDNGNWRTLETKEIPRIAANSSETISFQWKPEASTHTCISIGIFPQAGEISSRNNRAQENIAVFDSAGASSHEPAILDAMVRSPFTVWRRVDLRILGLPEGWHATVDKRFVWVPPLGEVPVTAVIWTDLDSPRRPDQDEKKIPPEAFVRVEGWTTFGDHRYLPIGGILAAVRANAKSRIKASVDSQGNNIIVSARLFPPESGVAGVVEFTRDSDGVAWLVPFTTNADGAIDVVEKVDKDAKYRVQVFTSATASVAEADSNVSLVSV